MGRMANSSPAPTNPRPVVQRTRPREIDSGNVGQWNSGPDGPVGEVSGFAVTGPKRTVRVDKLESTTSPAGAHPSPVLSDTGRASSTVENTPISTPVGVGAHPTKADREPDHFAPASGKPRPLGASPFHPDSPLLDGELADYSFPLFVPSPPAHALDVMNGTRVVEHGLASSASLAPALPCQTSNLTSALRGVDLSARARCAAADEPADDDGDGSASRPPPAPSRHASFSHGASGVALPGADGARPISMTRHPNQPRPRRESVAGSVMGGISWGGISVASSMRDDVVATGTSPFSPPTPYHASSYLPNLEAKFMRDFSCCGITLPTLHDLLHHYEEFHAPQTLAMLPRSLHAAQLLDAITAPSNKAALAAGAAAAVQQQQHQLGPRPANGVGTSGPAPHPDFGAGASAYPRPMPSHVGGFKASLSPVRDLDVVADMEMADAMDLAHDERAATPINAIHPTPSPFPRLQPHPPHRHAMRPQPPPLDLGGTGYAPVHGHGHGHGHPSPMHQGLRTPQPGTPSSAHSGRHLLHNPTVSSVNTPTLTTQPPPSSSSSSSPARPLLPNAYAATTSTTTDGSAYGGVGVGRPFDLGPGAADMLPTPVSAQFGPSHAHVFGGVGIGPGSGFDMRERCIDDPAKRLFSHNGAFLDPTLHDSFRLEAGASDPDDRECVKRRKSTHRGADGGSGSGVAGAADPKPFRCPVVGCEKAYKNQNGLKYHKTHGHTNQQLHENGDGTLSIVNPETSIPYPGTLGMEKEKPHGCETCGKRYKNMNGLKYHKAHSPPCNPDPSGMAPSPRRRGGGGGGGGGGGVAVGGDGDGEADVAEATIAGDAAAAATGSDASESMSRAILSSDMDTSPA
ncbi:MAG: Transcriptional regulator of ribosomal biogenesis proteins [Phylliscum demangeonii]|nr:MAG: Transcriptional regulator of ribosomal biogenesis proteins [Phylliscum demangeonii]